MMFLEEFIWQEQLLTFKIACFIHQILPKRLLCYGNSEIHLNVRLLVLNHICINRAGPRKQLTSLWILQSSGYFLNSLLTLKPYTIKLKNMQDMAHRQIAHLRWHVACSDLIIEKENPKRKGDQGVNYLVILSCTSATHSLEHQIF